MLRKSILFAVVFAGCSTFGAQISVPDVIIRGKCETGLPQFEE